MGAQQCRQPVRRSYRQLAVWGQCSAVLLRPAYHRASAVDPMGALWQAAVVVGQSSRWWTSAWPHHMRNVKASGRREVPELLRIGTRSRQTPTRRTRKQARRIRTRTDSSQTGSLLPSNHFADLFSSVRYGVFWVIVSACGARGTDLAGAVRRVTDPREPST